MTFDPYDPEVQELMATKAEAQGQAVGVGRDRMAMPSIHQAVMARRAADPTTVLDDFDAEHEDMRRAATPAMDRPQGGIVYAQVYVGGAASWVQIGHYDPEPARQAMRKMERQLLDTIKPAVEAAGAAFAKAQEAFVKAGAELANITMELTDWDAATIARAFDVPEEMLTGKPDPGRLARRRHGHAAVCPKHGPTKGGLCRKCQR